jgi:hypothetical protein
MKKLLKKQIRADKEADRIAAGIITKEEAQAEQDHRRADAVSADRLLTLAASEWSHRGQHELIKLIELYYKKN